MISPRSILLGAVTVWLPACFSPSSSPTAETSLSTTDPTAGTTTDPTLATGESSSGETSIDPSTSLTTTDPTIADSSESSSTGPAPMCGNDEVEEGEECDNGGADMYCDGDCTMVVCGDGYENFPAGEYCDPGGDGETALCNSDCTTAMCGDMIVNAAAGEECDDGEATINCNSDCTSASCGDGVLNEKGFEECDDGGESATCNADCTIAECGDEIVNTTAGEDCDEGGEESATCDDDCTVVVCGDGNSNYEAGEVCDDGNQIPDDFCDNNCYADCGNDCWSDLGCITDGGRCIRFTCAAGQDSDTACSDCFGWVPITYENWLMDGYCQDVSAMYRATEGYATKCGGAPLCCSDPAGCGGGDNAWHFHNGMNNYYVGPCLGCMDADNCTYWNNVDDGQYTRITACIRG